MLAVQCRINTIISRLGCCCCCCYCQTKVEFLSDEPLLCCQDKCQLSQWYPNLQCTVHHWQLATYLSFLLVCHLLNKSQSHFVVKPGGFSHFRLRAENSGQKSLRWHCLAAAVFHICHPLHGCDEVSLIRVFASRAGSNRSSGPTIVMLTVQQAVNQPSTQA